MRISFIISELCIFVLGITGIATLIIRVIIPPTVPSHTIGSTIATSSSLLDIFGKTSTTSSSSTLAQNATLLAWSPAGNLIAYSNNGSLVLWNVTTGKEEATCCQDPVEKDTIQTIAWSPDGKWIATGSDNGKITIWNIATRTQIASYNGSECQSELSPSCSISIVTWSPDGKYIVSGSCEAQDLDPLDVVAIQIHNAVTGKLILSYHGHTGCIEAMTWSPINHTIISSSSDGDNLFHSTLQIWDAYTGNTLFSYRDHLDRSLTALASPNGKYIAIADMDQKVTILNANTRKPVYSYILPISGKDVREAPDMMWSPDSTRLSYFYYNGLHILNAFTGDEIVTFDDFCCGVVQTIWSADSTRIAYITDDSRIVILQASQDSSLLSPQGRFFNTITLLSLCGIIFIVAITLFLTVYFRRKLNKRKIATLLSAAFVGIIGLTYLALFMDAQVRPQIASFSLGTTFYNFDGNTVTWSPDSTRIATGLINGTIYVWDASTGERIFTNHVRLSNVTTLSWSPDGTRIAAGYNDGTVQILDASTGQNLYIYTGHTNSISRVAWSPDNIHIASESAPDHIINIWQASGTFGKTLVEHRGAYFAWSPDGSLIASSDGANSVDIWQASAGKDILHYRSRATQVTSVAWSPNGAYLASGNDNGIIDIWDAHTGTWHSSYNGLDQPVRALSWSPDNLHIAAGADEIHIFDALTGNHAFSYIDQTIQFDTFSVLALAWSPDGTRIASAASQGNVRIWKATQSSDAEVLSKVPTQLFLFGGIFIFLCLALFFLLFLFQRIITKKAVLRVIYTILLMLTCLGSILDISVLAVQVPQFTRALAATKRASAQPIFLDHYHGDRAALSPDGKYLATSWGTTVVQIWDLKSGNRVLTYRSYTSKVNVIAWSPDGTRIAAGCSDGMIRVWNARTGRDLLTYSGQTASIQTLIWSSDSTRLFSVSNNDLSNDPSINIWNISTGQTLLSLRPSIAATSISDIAWSPDGTRIGIATFDLGTEILDATTGRVLMRYPTASVGALAWSPNGQTIAFALTPGSGDEGIQEWSASQPSLLLSIKGPTTFSLAWSSDGRYIITDEYIWNATTGQLLTSFTLFDEFGSICAQNAYTIALCSGYIVYVRRVPVNL